MVEVIRVLVYVAWVLPAQRRGRGCFRHRLSLSGESGGLAARAAQIDTDEEIAHLYTYERLP
jgi:hypothetical protein